MAPSLPSTVVDAWLRVRGACDVVPVGGGLSGAEVYCARAADDRRWAVRGWPSATAGKRVGEIHRVMRLARRQGCQWMPAVEIPEAAAATVDLPIFGGDPVCWIVAAGRVWDCSQWMPGQPPGAQDDPVEVLGQVAAAVAQFHIAVAGLAQSQGPAAAVTSRLQRLAEFSRCIDRLLTSTGRSGAAAATDLGRRRAADLGGGTAVERATECLRVVWARQRPRAAQLLQPWAHRSLRQQYVFRDIHLGNTLFANGRLSGIVDHDAVRVDSPATDLARLIGSVRLIMPPQQWQQSAETLWSAMLAGYRSSGAFSMEEERLCRALAEVSPLIVLANWVVWVVCERRSFPAPAARIDERIEGWTQIVRHQFELEAPPFR